MNRLLVRIQIYESMLRDSLWSPEREAERRRREAEHRWTQFELTGHTVGTLKYSTQIPAYDIFIS